MKADDEVITRLINKVVESMTVGTLCSLHALLCVDGAGDRLRESAYKEIMRCTDDSGS